MDFKFQIGDVMTFKAALAGNPNPKVERLPRMRVAQRMDPGCRPPEYSGIIIHGNPE